MHEVDRGVYYDRYVYYDMGMLAWHAAVRRYPRLAIGRLGGSRGRWWGAPGQDAESIQRIYRRLYYYYYSSK